MLVSRTDPQPVTLPSNNESKFTKDLSLLTELLLRLKGNYENLLNKPNGSKNFDNSGHKITKEVVFANIERIQRQIKTFCDITISTSLTLESDEENMLREIISVLNHPTERQLTEYKNHNWKKEPNQKLKDEHQKLEGVVDKLLSTRWKAWESPESCLVKQPVLTAIAKEELQEVGKHIFGHFKILEESIKKYQGSGTYTHSGSVSLTHNISKLREILHRIKDAEVVPLQKAYELVQILEQHRVLIAHFAYYAVGGHSENNYSEHLWMNLPMDVKPRKYLNGDNSEEIIVVNFLNRYLTEINSKIQNLSKHLNFPKDWQEEMNFLVNAYLENPYAEKLCLELERLNMESFEGNFRIEHSKIKNQNEIIAQFISLKQYVGKNPDVAIPFMDNSLFIFQGRDDFYITGPNNFWIGLNNDNKTLKYSSKLNFEATAAKEFVDVISKFLKNEFVTQDQKMDAQLKLNVNYSKLMS